MMKKIIILILLALILFLLFNILNTFHLEAFFSEYDNSEENQWTQLGEDIVGQNERDESGSSVSLSSDGKTVAIGAYLNDGNGENSGHVRVYRYMGDEWTQLGGDIVGEYEGDFSGSSVSLSSDGSVVAIGAMNNYGEDLNYNYNLGHVRVYEYDETKTDRVTNQVSPDFGPKGWRRIGRDIDGQNVGDLSGSSVSLSSNGKTIAIGAFGNDGNGDNSGLVRVFKNNFLSNVSKTPTTQTYRTSPTAQYTQTYQQQNPVITNQNVERGDISTIPKNCEPLFENPRVISYLNRCNEHCVNNPTDCHPLLIERIKYLQSLNVDSYN